MQIVYVHDIQVLQQIWNQLMRLEVDLDECL